MSELLPLLTDPMLILVVLFGLYMAWNIGANDVANAMGTSVGSGALTLKRAVLIAAVLEFAGAFLVGAHVTDTVRSEIVDPAMFAGDAHAFMLGMLASLLAAGAWLQVASYFGWPVSTTHSIVGAIIGFGLVHLGVQAIHWDKVTAIAASWVISPALSAAISFLIFQLIRHSIFRSTNPVAAAKQLTPLLVFFVFVILTFVLLYKGLANRLSAEELPLWATVGATILVGAVAAAISHLLVRRIPHEHVPAPTRPFHETSIHRSLRKARKHLQRIQEAVPASDLHLQASTLLEQLDKMRAQAQGLTAAARKPADHQEYQTVERIFMYLQILSACFVAFSHGANDVANAIGPMAAVVQTAQAGLVQVDAHVPLWLLALGGVGIVVGLATWGWRVIETIGRRITELTPTRGFAAEFGAATTIVVASKLGLPISTTHTLVGAVLGVGLARGIGALNLRTVRDIVISWVVTLPAGAVLAIVFFYILQVFF